MKRQPFKRRPRQPVLVNCKAIACVATTHAPYLMCVDHWRMVPVAIRRQVVASHQRIGKEPGARETHAKAVQAAIDAVHGKALAKKARRDAGTGDLFGAGTS